MESMYERDLAYAQTRAFGKLAQGTALGGYNRQRQQAAKLLKRKRLEGDLAVSD
jgi:hypothetical protein